MPITWLRAFRTALLNNGDPYFTDNILTDL